MKKGVLKLCLVTREDCCYVKNYEKFITEAVLGGVTLVQFRCKNTPFSRMLKMALKLKSLLKSYGIPILVNDYIELALQINADGVHLGQNDIHPEKARKLLGQGKIIGLSIESMENLYAANKLKCLDYVAASAVFETKTKQNCKKIWSLEGLHELCQNSKFPVIAIGGIHLNNVSQVVAHGAAGIAVVSAIHESKNTKETAEQFIHILNNALN